MKPLRAGKAIRSGVSVKSAAGALLYVDDTAAFLSAQAQLPLSGVAAPAVADKRCWSKQK